jgi:hypothetical protein
MTGEVKLELKENKTGRFYIRDNQEEIARLEIRIAGNELLALHTEVNSGHEGKGFAKKLFLEMVDYARKNQLKVKAYCPYIQTQFKKSPEEFEDVISK